MKKYFVRSLFSIMLVFSCFSTAHVNAADINDAAALAGISQAKSIFLIDFTNAKKTAFYLDIIRGTHKGLERQNVKSQMVLVFIGKTVQFLSTEPDDELAMEFQSHLTSIQHSIKEFAKLGGRMEVCAIATRVFNVKNNSIPDEMNLVGDGFISLIGWQTQGHKLVPIF